jgi:uncharacterized protein with von Willebrand factor type A (vWA) domain
MICHVFRTKHDIPIEFSLTNPSAGGIGGLKHFILIIDDSGSMSGSRWDNASKSLSNFLAKA